MEQAQVAAPYESAGQGGTPLWWIPLVSGSLWIIFAIVVFRFDYTTVSAVSILVGCVCLAGALFEAIAAAATHGWWRILNIGLAVVFAIIGVVAFVHPGDTFEALASVFAFYLLLRGTFDIVVAILARGVELWWVGLISGTVQILLAFWAAGDFGHKAFLLVVWVGASALAHGIVQIVTAFRLRNPHSA
ncbi:MAG: HdeD family acid-resistance protein [Gaiellaceae bacterium]